MGKHGAIAQMGERLPCTQEVGGSIPPGSTISNLDNSSTKANVIPAKERHPREGGDP